MPCNYTVEPEHRFVTVRAWGIFTYAEAMATRQQFIADPAHNADVSIIYDLTDVTELEMTSEQIRGLARFSPLVSGVRRAIAAPADAIFGAMRMLQLDYQAGGGSNEIGVFRRLDQAKAWLRAGQPR